MNDLHHRIYRLVNVADRLGHGVHVSTRDQVTWKLYTYSLTVLELAIALVGKGDLIRAARLDIMWGPGWEERDNFWRNHAR